MIFFWNKPFTRRKSFKNLLCNYVKKMKKIKIIIFKMQFTGFLILKKISNINFFLVINKSLLLTKRIKTMKFFYIFVIFSALFFQFNLSATSNLKNAKNNKNLKNSKKQKDECDCQCKQQIIAVQKEFTIPRVRILDDNDEGDLKSFHDFKLYKLAKNFNALEQEDVDKNEIRKLLHKEGIMRNL